MQTVDKAIRGRERKIVHRTYSNPGRNRPGGDEYASGQVATALAHQYTRLIAFGYLGV